MVWISILSIWLQSGKDIVIWRERWNAWKWICSMNTGSFRKLPVHLDLIDSDPGSYSETDSSKDRHIIMCRRIIISMVRFAFVMETASFLQDGVMIPLRESIVKR